MLNEKAQKELKEHLSKKIDLLHNKVVLKKKMKIM